MELFNYVRNSGYERESPFVNDVKFHPVLKAKKSFASGILAAFMSSEPTQPTKQVEQENMENNQANVNPTNTDSSFLSKLKKKVSL